MGDDDQAAIRPRPGPHEVVGEPGDTFDVEMVGRLVQEEQVGLGHQGRGQCHPATLAAGHRAHPRIQAPDGGGLMIAKQARQDIANPGLAGPIVFGPLAEDDLAHGRCRVK